jgi:acyl-CoA thioester hydrolase
VSYTRFAAYIRVRHHELDTLGHLNNAVYLHYLEQAAIDHAAALGFTMERLRTLGGLFIAHRHEIDYLQPANAGDLLQIVTWAEEMKGAQATRCYEVYRYPATDPATVAAPAGHLLPADATLPGPPLVRARTLWVWIDPERGRPRRIPPEIIDAFMKRET